MICTRPCMFYNFYLSVHWSLLVNTAGNTSQIQQWNAEKGCQIISKLTVKTFRVTYLCSYVSQVTLFLFFCFCFCFFVFFVNFNRLHINLVSSSYDLLLPPGIKWLSMKETRMQLFNQNGKSQLNLILIFS